MRIRLQQPCVLYCDCILTYVPEPLNSSLSFGLLPRYESASTFNEIQVLSYDSMTILISFNKDVVRPESLVYISR
jgi:hypothetical protein